MKDKIAEKLCLGDIIQFKSSNIPKYSSFQVSAFGAITKVAVLLRLLLTSGTHRVLQNM